MHAGAGTLQPVAHTNHLNVPLLSSALFITTGSDIVNTVSDCGNVSKLKTLRFTDLVV